MEEQGRIQITLESQLLDPASETSCVTLIRWGKTGNGRTPCSLKKKSIKKKTLGKSVW